MKIILLNNPVAKKEQKVVLPPVREKAAQLRPGKRRNHIGPLVKADFKFISDVLHNRCMTHCSLKYGNETCLGMECYRTLQKVEQELNRD